MDGESSPSSAAEVSSSSSLPMMLVSANVGSIFEDPEVLLKTWVKEFLKTVSEHEPHFLALHCQEVGGKNYEESMKHVENFVSTLLASKEMSEFVHVKVFLDEDFSSTEKFTALGNLYFIHHSIDDCQIWNFHTNSFVPVEGHDIQAGNIENVPIKEKDKFPKEFFPECKWSRKGFMRTRWNISGTIFDLVNIHLFHDASNFEAMESFPSSYSQTRKEALKYTLDRFERDPLDNVPFFLFGDFNFRLNTGEVVKRLTKEAVPSEVIGTRGTRERLEYKKSNNSQTLLTLGKKVFDLSNHEDTFYQFQSNNRWLLEHDIEINEFKDRIFEFDITFPPSYPFTEDNCGTTYMKTRCPAWCDRILLSHSAKQIIHKYMNDESNVTYLMMGSDVPMGDHKPIVLKLELKKLIPGNIDSPSNIVLEHLNQEEHDPAIAREGTITEGVEIENDARIISDNDETLFKSIDTTISNHPALRSRTTSNPSMMVNRPIVRTGFEKRRINSLHPHQPPVHTIHSFKVHSPEWLKKAHAFISGQDINSDPEEYDCNSINSQSIKSKNKRVPKRKLSRVSSRLTSHHSSSSEEWYSELPDVQEISLSDPFGNSGPASDQQPQKQPISTSPPAETPQTEPQSTNSDQKTKEDRRRSSIASKAEEHTSCLKCSIM